jgi:hypothetical protein
MDLWRSFTTLTLCHAGIPVWPHSKRRSTLLDLDVQSVRVVVMDNSLTGTIPLHLIQ